jgi:hypothetical protein
MDRHAEQAVNNGAARVGARRGFPLAALLLTLASGCVTMGELTPDAVPANQVGKVVGMWTNQVLNGVDPAHQGAPMHGLAGRVFLYPVDMSANLIADGNLVIEMYATLPEQPQGPQVLLETWELKKETLNSVCLRRDGFGEGYTMNLPWPSYRPDISQVRMRIRYVPPKGLPVYEESMVPLNKGAAPEITASHRMEGPNHQPIMPGPPAGPPPQVGGMPTVQAPFQGAPPQGPPVPQAGVVQTSLYQAPVQQPAQGPPVPQPGMTQPALYQAPVPQAGQAPQLPPVPPPPWLTQQPPPGASQR